MINHRQWIGASVLIIAYLIGMLGHLHIAKFFVSPRQSDWLGTFHWADFIPHLGLATGMALLAWQSWRARRGQNCGWTLAVWLVWLLMVLAFDRWLIFSIPSYIHYLFYGALAYALAWLHDPKRKRFAIGPVVFAITLMGIADETLQYTWTTTAYSHYLDFNDFLLNMLAAIGGAWLYYGFAGWHVADVRDHRRNQRAVSAFFGLGLIAAAGLAAVYWLQARAGQGHSLWPIERRADSYGHWAWTPYRDQYFILDPVAGSALIIGIGLLVSGLPVLLQRLRFGQAHQAFSD